MLANHREVLAMAPTSSATTDYGKHGLSVTVTCLFRLNSRATIVPLGTSFLSTNSKPKSNLIESAIADVRLRCISTSFFRMV